MTEHKRECLRRALQEAAGDEKELRGRITAHEAVIRCLQAELARAVAKQEDFTAQLAGRSLEK